MPGKMKTPMNDGKPVKTKDMKKPGYMKGGMVSGGKRPGCGKKK